MSRKRLRKEPRKKSRQQPSLQAQARNSNFKDSTTPLSASHLGHYSVLTKQKHDIVNSARTAKATALPHCTSHRNINSGGSNVGISHNICEGSEFAVKCKDFQEYLLKRIEETKRSIEAWQPKNEESEWATRMDWQRENTVVICYVESSVGTCREGVEVMV
jgi:hypothetical protein